MTKYKCKYCDFIHTETEYRAYIEEDQYFHGVLINGRVTNYWITKLLDHLFPLHKNQVPFIWGNSDIVEQFEVIEEKEPESEPENQIEKEYQCMTCMIKFNDWVDASMHEWEIHDGYMTEEDLPTHYLVNGQDLRLVE